MTDLGYLKYDAYLNNLKNYRIYWLFFAAALAFSISVLCVGWWQPIMDMYGFRQTQTAISAYYLNFSNFFTYETPVLGPPWSIPFEFPLYQGLVKCFSVCFHYPLDQSGRLIDIVFLMASLLPVVGILREFGFALSSIALVLGCSLVSPVYLFWSHTFMIESLALFLSLSYFWCGLKSKKNKKLNWILFTVFFGALAALVKITTFFTYGFALGIYLVIEQKILFPTQSKEVWIKKLLWIASLTFPPIVVGMIWTHFADHQKMLNPLANFITSSQLKNWNFGTLDQKLSWKTWTFFLCERTQEAVGSPYFIILIFLSLIWATRIERKMILSLSVLYFFTFAVFTNLHLIHSYYQFSCAILLMAALALAIDVLSRKGTVILGLGLIILVSGVSINVYRRHYEVSQKNPTHYIPDLGKEISTYTSPEDVLLIYGLDWSSELPYYSGRRALMDRHDLSLQEPTIAAAIERMNENHLHISAMVVCGKHQADLEFIRERVEALDLKNKRHEDGRCTVYSKT